MKIIKIITTVIPFLFMFNTQAEIFKCTNPNGAVYYNDRPCPVKDKQKKIKAAKDVVNGYVSKPKPVNPVNPDRVSRRKMKTATATTSSTVSAKKREKKADNSNVENNNKSDNKNTATSNKTNKSNLTNKSLDSLSTEPSIQPASLHKNSLNNEAQSQAEAVNERELIDMLAGQTTDKY